MEADGSPAPMMAAMPAPVQAALEPAMPRMERWGSRDLLLTFAMWAVMMVGMMTPSAAPLVLLFARVQRDRRERAAPHLPTSLFLLGYLLVWGAFAVASTLAQWGLHSAALLSPRLVATSPLLGGLLLVLAGLFQLTPLKDACLKNCRTPLSFIMTGWREGRWGAVRMGLSHGFYCVGCCGLLMALLFVGGVMNLLWVGALSLFVLLEKLVPSGPWVSRAAGALLLAAGAGVALGVRFP